MAALIALEPLIRSGRVWRGEPEREVTAGEPTGLMALDRALPLGGWPRASVSEVLLPADGVGELRLVLPALARITQAGRAIALIAPPYLPCPGAWRARGVDFSCVHLVQASTSKEALWAAEQCLRSGALDAVLFWPHQADDRALRRLQVAAETGQTMGFCFRDQQARANPSPAALRLLIEVGPPRVRVLKCRGGNPPLQAIPLAAAEH